MINPRFKLIECQLKRLKLRQINCAQAAPSLFAPLSLPLSLPCCLKAKAPQGQVNLIKNSKAQCKFASQQLHGKNHAPQSYLSPKQNNVVQTMETREKRAMQEPEMETETNAVIRNANDAQQQPKQNTRTHIKWASREWEQREEEGGRGAWPRDTSRPYKAGRKEGRKSD